MNYFIFVTLFIFSAHFVNSPLNSYLYIHWILDFKYILLLQYPDLNICYVAAVVEDSGVLSLGVLKYIVCLCNGCCVFCLYCEAWRCRCSCMGSVSVLSYRCCMFVSCVHPVAVLNAGRGCKR